MSAMSPRERHPRSCGSMSGLGEVLAGLAVATTLAGAAAARAQPSPNGPEFQVNTYTTNGQYFPSVAVDGQGNFVVAWQSLGSDGTDTSSWSIQAQRYAANGTPLGGQFQVNTYTTNYQIYPSVAVDGEGNFVVAWESLGSDGTDTSSRSIQAQRFAANGVPLGGQFQVNTYTTSYQDRPSVAIDGQGSFVVAWDSFGSNGTDTSTLSIQAQRYAANGAPLGGQFQVNTYTDAVQLGPSVAIDGQGNIVVAWFNYGPAGNRIQAQRYAANGTPVGGEFQVNTYAWGGQSDPSVAIDGDSNFVVAWTSGGSDGTDTSAQSIQAQRYAANGTPLGGQFQVNVYTTGVQRHASVAADGQDNFVVAWSSDGSSGTDTSRYSIQAQRYAANGAPVGDQFQVNTSTTQFQFIPSLAVDRQGNFVVAWGSFASGGTDTSSWSIQAQRYDQLFRDGFEAGDTARWSAAAP